MCIHVWFLLKAVFTPADAIVLSIPGLLVEQLGMSVSVRLTPAAAIFIIVVATTSTTKAVNPSVFSKHRTPMRNETATPRCS